MKKYYHEAKQGLPFSKGVLVRIRSKNEIIATLDETGAMDGLPFMPEMYRYCGGVYKITKCINRILVEGHGVHGLKDAFILEGARCGGFAHENCSRLCNILWKSAWLEILKTGNKPANEMSQTVQGNSVLNSLHYPSACQGQAAQLLTATEPLSFWNPRQYMQDIRTGTMSIRGVLCILFYTIINRIYWRFLKIYRQRFRWTKPVFHHGLPVPIRAGDMVEVLSKKEIQRTLDKNNKYQGLLFSEAMWRCCRKRYRVLRKVANIVVEETGSPQTLQDTYLLAGVVCDGKSFRGCSRECYWFWKGVWLKPIDEID